MPNEDEFKDFQNPNAASFDKLVVAIDRAYHRPFVMIGRAFLQGLMTALGATIGAAIFFTITLYILQAMGGIQLLQPMINRIEDMIISKTLTQESNSLDQQQIQTLVNEQVNKLNSPTPTP